MLEAIISPFTARVKTWEMFFIGILYYSVACLLSLWVFREYASIVVLLFTVIAVLPLIYNTLRTEEKAAAKEERQIKTLIEHIKYFKFMMFFFGGIVAASALWYIFTPSGVMQSLFDVQMNTLMGITGRMSFSTQMLAQIFFNNIKVLIFCILFSFVYGSGAIFILTWNASVIGAAVGYFIRTKIATIASLTGFEYLSNYFGIFAIGLTKYIIHGIPEILAYYIGGLAGSIISVGVIKREYKTYKFSRIMWDASNLIILAILITFIAAILEVYVTPRVFN